MRKISVIIPQYGHSELTAAAVGTFCEHHLDLPEILIVDDGSSAEELRSLRKRLPGHVTILQTRKRRGVTAAWNMAGQRAAGEVLIFLNNDTLTHGPWLDTLLLPLCEDAERMVGTEVRVDPDLPDGIRNLPAMAGVLSGWCLGIPRRLWSLLGGFDPQFHLYFSDTDLQCRLLQRQRSGACLIAVPELPLEHLEHRTTRSLATRRDAWRADRCRFLRKWNLRGA